MLYVDSYTGIQQGRIHMILNACGVFNQLSENKKKSRQIIIDTIASFFLLSLVHLLIEKSPISFQGGRFSATS